MKRKVLVVLNGDENSEILNDSILYLKENYKLQVTGLYVKTFEEKVTSSNPYVAENIMPLYKKLDDDMADRIISNKNNLNLDDIVVREGGATEEILDELLAYDFLMIEETSINKSTTKSLIKSHFKPIIIVKEKAINFDSVLLANDKGASINKSAFSFINIFSDIKEIKSISINNTLREDRLIDYFKDSGIDYKIMLMEGDPKRIINKISNDYSFMVMGDLAHINYLETLGGHQGLKILDNMKTSIFIG